MTRRWGLFGDAAQPDAFHGFGEQASQFPFADPEHQAAAGESVKFLLELLVVFGELGVSPVGRSLVTKLSPLRIVGLMMGVWFLSNSAGNKLAGWAAGFFSTVPLTQIFSTVATVTIAAGVVMFLLVRPMRGIMGNIR